MTCPRIGDPSALSIGVTLVAIVLAIRAASGDEGEARTLAIDADFPGGNIVLERIDGDDIYLHQDLRDTSGDWFWWYFRVRGAAGRTLTFHFTKSNVIGVRGPAVSTDSGGSWTWLGPEAVDGASFRYASPDHADEVRLSFAIPYVERNLSEFIKRHADDPDLDVRSLCTTRKGREVRCLRLRAPDAGSAHRVLITARHHCCESIASYALEGLIEAALADTDDGQWLRDHVEFMIVPFMDKDGVEDGDQGKNRRPHDHNRDYDGESIYPSVAALRELAPAWSDGCLRVALDLHCPHIRGPSNEVIYMVGSRYPAVWEQQEAFGRNLESVCTGPLPYRVENNLPFGKGWNTGSNYGGGKSSSRWASELPGVRLATTIEIPYANVAGQVVTVESARAFGRDLARAIRRYLERSSAPTSEGTVREP